MSVGMKKENEEEEDVRLNRLSRFAHLRMKFNEQEDCDPFELDTMRVKSDGNIPRISTSRCICLQALILISVDTLQIIQHFVRWQRRKIRHSHKLLLQYIYLSNMKPIERDQCRLDLLPVYGIRLRRASIVSNSAPRVRPPPFLVTSTSYSAQSWPRQRHHPPHRQSAY